MGKVILVVDDHPLVRFGLATALSTLPDVTRVRGVGTLDEARRVLTEPPDVVVLDDALPDGSGIGLLPAIASACPRVRVVALVSAPRVGSLRRAMRRGVFACLGKDAPVETVKATVRAALRDDAEVRTRPTKPPPSSRAVLSDRQREVLGLMAHGSTNPEIAAMLAISRGTVRTHVSTILHRLWASDRTEAVARAIREGLV